MTDLPADTCEQQSPEDKDACLAQVSAIKQSIAELRAGLKKAETEIETAQRLGGSGEGAELMEAFASSMAAFHDAAAASVKATEVCLTAAATFVKQVHCMLLQWLCCI